MHNFALLASAVLCCICIKSGSEPLTTPFPCFCAIYLPSTLHFGRCLRIAFHYCGECFLYYFYYLQLCPAPIAPAIANSVGAVCVHFAYERVHIFPPIPEGYSAPCATIFTIKKLNTKFTLSLDGLAVQAPCHALLHGPETGRDIVIIAIVVVYRMGFLRCGRRWFCQTFQTWNEN